MPSQVLPDVPSAAVVRFLDHLLGLVANDAEAGSTAARDAVRRCFDDVAPGANPTWLAAVLLIHMLDDIARRADLVAAAPELHAMLAQVTALHEGARDGTPADHAQWTAMRSAAVALTGTLLDPLLEHAARAIEAAAWNLATSHGILVDVLRSYHEVVLIDAAQRAGWSAADEQASARSLQAIYDETAPRREAGKDVSIAEIFQAREPAFAARFEQALHARQLGGSAGLSALLNTSLSVLTGASVLTR